MRRAWILVLLCLADSTMPAVASAQVCVQSWCPNHGFVECGHYCGPTYVPPPPPPPSPEELERRRKRRVATEWNEKGLAAAADKAWERAVGAFEQAAELQPDDEAVAENLTNARYQLERWKAEQERKRQEARAKRDVTAGVLEAAGSLESAPVSASGLGFSGDAPPVFRRIGTGASAADVKRASECLLGGLDRDRVAAGAPARFTEEVRKSAAKLRSELASSPAGTPIIDTLDEQKNGMQVIVAVGFVRDAERREVRLDAQWHFGKRGSEPREGQATVILDETGAVAASEVSEEIQKCLSRGAAPPSASLSFAGAAETKPERSNCTCPGADCRCLREGMCGGTQKCGCGSVDCGCATSCKFAGAYSACSGSHQDDGKVRCNATCDCAPTAAGCACTVSCGCAHRKH